MGGGWERDEWRASLRRQSPWNVCPPGEHRMVSDRAGGGLCTSCGDTVGADEL